MLRIARRAHWSKIVIAATSILLIVGWTAASVAIGESAEVAELQAVGAEAVEQFGEFERLDPGALDDGAKALGAGTALAGARQNEFGKPHVPEGSLLRVVNSDAGLIPLEKGTLVWLFRWSNQGDEYPKGFQQDEGGEPNATVFVLDDYFLLVDAATGEVIASVQH